MNFSLNARNIVVALVAAFLLLLPLYSQLSGNVFALTLFTRIVIFALAAVSLNLIMGYGGMMSFGHAAYLGIGGYAVGILAFEGVGSGFIQWPVALLASALFALVIGALSLRTRGVYFIMITLAFAQMAYYVASGLARYGGDDGLTIYKRSDFAGLINLSSKVQFYYLCLACLFGGIYLVWRIVNSRFGLVVQGLRSNEARMQAIGFPATRYRLVCFVIAGTICGLAGAVRADHGVHFVRRNIERDPVGRDHTAEAPGQAFGLQQRASHHAALQADRRCRRAHKSPPAAGSGRGSGRDIR